MIARLFSVVTHLHLLSKGQILICVIIFPSKTQFTQIHRINIGLRQGANTPRNRIVCIARRIWPSTITAASA